MAIKYKGRYVAQVIIDVDDFGTLSSDQAALFTNFAPELKQWIEEKIGDESHGCKVDVTQCYADVWGVGEADE